MKRRFTAVAAGFLLSTMAVFVMVGCDESGKDDGAEHATGGDSAHSSDVHEVGTGTDMVARGKHLVTVLGCNDCHSAKTISPEGMPMIDQSMLMAGHPADLPMPKYDANLIGMGPDKAMIMNIMGTAAAGPWGVSYAANLTPSESGIKNWTEAQFIKAIREGKYQGMDNTRPIMPPMPWEGYKELSDTDLKAIYAYLMSIPAVDNIVPAYQPPAGAPPMGGEPPPATPGQSDVPQDGASDSGA